MTVSRRHSRSECTAFGKSTSRAVVLFFLILHLISVYAILVFKLKTRYNINDGKCKLSKKRGNLRELPKKLDKENIWISYFLFNFYNSTITFGVLLRRNEEYVLKICRDIFTNLGAFHNSRHISIIVFVSWDIIYFFFHTRRNFMLHAACIPTLHISTNTHTHTTVFILTIYYNIHATARIQLYRYYLYNNLRPRI